jgi:hypothetical protein
LLNRVKSPFWEDAQGLTGRENATSGKCEGRFYMMKSAAAKKTARNFWQPKPSQKQLQKPSRAIDFQQENRLIF